MKKYKNQIKKYFHFLKKMHIILGLNENEHTHGIK